MTDLKLDIDRYDRSGGDPANPRLRGTSIGSIGSGALPGVTVTDNGEVWISSSFRSIPAADALAWFRAVADHIEARMDAS